LHSQFQNSNPATTPSVGATSGGFSVLDQEKFNSLVKQMQEHDRKYRLWMKRSTRETINSPGYKFCLERAKEYDVLSDKIYNIIRFDLIRGRNYES